MYTTRGDASHRQKYLSLERIFLIYLSPGPAIEPTTTIPSYSTASLRRGTTATYCRAWLCMELLLKTVIHWYAFLSPQWSAIPVRRVLLDSRCYIRARNPAAGFRFFGIVLIAAAENDYYKLHGADSDAVFQKCTTTRTTMTRTTRTAFNPLSDDVSFKDASDRDTPLPRQEGVEIK